MKKEKIIIELILIVFVCSSPFLSCQNVKKNLTPVSTIDTSLQTVAEKELRQAMKGNNDSWGCVAMMSVETGEIKVMVNLLQDTMNDKFSKAPNYAATKRISPGHLFALASMMACFEDNVICLNDSVVVGEKAIFQGVTMKDAKEGGLGKVTFQQAFEVSSNIGIAKLINTHYSHCPQKFIDHIIKFKLDKPLGIDGVKEPDPRLNTPSSPTWSRASLSWLAIGYECKMTPFQILAFYNAVANNGKMVRPFFQKCDTTKIPYVLKEQICSSSTLKKTKEMLLVRGTSLLRNIMGPVEIAGHSATVREIDVSEKGMKENLMMSVVYFPAGKPKYTCISVISTDKYKYFNSSSEVIKGIIGFIVCNGKKK